MNDPKYRRFRFKGIRMRETTWDAMEVLDHVWRLMNRSAIHHRTRGRLVKFGFAEFQDRGKHHIRGRLTAEGIDFRNRVYKERARRLNYKLWKDKWT